MTQKFKILLIWVFGNLILLGKYFFDKMIIRCEPCKPDLPCPPCQTDYMTNIWIYVMVLNAAAIGIGLVIMKLRK
jgi:hypothetical protein